jgi:pyruvate-ferredoxin/flavodoxin oxidoreductase
MEKITVDGNTASAHVAYAFSEVAIIYPITPSSPMGEFVDEWSANGKKNIFGSTLKVVEMQSEAGASGAVHGSLSAGALTTTFTASQGLLLMIPNMYKIAGELMPAVFHVAARAVAGQALSIFGDHSDVMAVRATGFALLASSSVQQIMDLGLVAHLASLKASIPFVHFFDGFRTSHEINKIEAIDYNDMAKLVDQESINNFRKRALNPEHPQMRGTAQNPDIFFQMVEKANPFYDKIPDIVSSYMDEVGELTGRYHKLFDYIGAPDAEHVVVVMGSGAGALEEASEYLNSRGEKTGLVEVHLYRPFSAKHFLDVLPTTVKKIAVLDRTKESGSFAEPLYLDVAAVCQDADRLIKIVGGRYGLGSKEFNSSMAKAVYDNLKLDKPKNHFTIGIEDDVTGKSLPVTDNIHTVPKGTIECMFWGLGSDGTVGANKEAIKIIGDNTNQYAQGYFSIDSKKSGGITVSHLRFGPRPINSSYLITNADYVAVHKSIYVDKYEVLENIKDNGIFVLNSPWVTNELMEKNLPSKLKRKIAQKNVKLYNIDANKISIDLGLNKRINMIMQTVFFKLANIIPFDDAVKELKDSIHKVYKKKGDLVIQMNLDSVDAAIAELKQISYPESWLNAELEKPIIIEDLPVYVTQMLQPVMAQQGNKLPVSVMLNGGIFPTSTSKYEKRAVALNVPEWIPETCIQCNQCAYVCPHATIRPFLLTEEEYMRAPQGYQVLEAKGKTMQGYKYAIRVNTYDCVGCDACSNVCPTDAIVMKPLETQIDVESPKWDYSLTLPIRSDLDRIDTVKGSQFLQPLFEYSGACAGCGETPYIKLVTQLFGDRMVIANATGCSSIYGGHAPSSPYTVNSKGHGPAWANSLFEDNAEYGLGIYTGINKRRSMLEEKIKECLNLNLPKKLKDSFIAWLEKSQHSSDSQMHGDAVKRVISQYPDIKSLDFVRNNLDLLSKPSIWIFGGDGWAYDIGYGGLDHVIATGEKVNILVLDTEVYSNTGGQSSKATQVGAVAKFAASGKKTKKKDLGLIAMSYGYVYVASVSLGANRGQYLKAVLEAEAYPGPSLIIAYAPCIAHGLKNGLGEANEEEKKAVESGYWTLYRYNPLLEKEGKNPFILDSREPTVDIKEFLDGETRFSSLMMSFPEEAEKLHSQLKRESQERYKKYKKMAEN